MAPSQLSITEVTSAFLYHEIKDKERAMASSLLGPTLLWLGLKVLLEHL